MKSLVTSGSCAIPFTSTPTTYHHHANITTTSPESLSTTLNHSIDFVSGKAHSSEISVTSPMSRLKSNDYKLPGSLEQFTTPVGKTHPTTPVTRTPIQLLKANPTSAAEVLCGSLPLLDDSKDDTVVEYRDESDDEGNLIIDLEEPKE